MRCVITRRHHFTTHRITPHRITPHHHASPPRTASRLTITPHHHAPHPLVRFHDYDYNHEY